MCKWLSRIGYKLLLVFSSILPKRRGKRKLIFIWIKSFYIKDVTFLK
ncbi:hypothetical protein D593_0278 [Streptococcus intermedius BA1]|nr:hypothetical protein D593_0278 [Streptococcus intermedius BA1]